MRRIIRRLEFGTEHGFSLLEVIIAMFVFAIVSVSAIHSLVSVLGVTRDSRNREIASNLASQAIDLARDTADVFALQDIEADDTGAQYVLNGETFTVTRETGWVSNPDIDEPCGQGGGIIRYKKVNIKVVWENMRGDEPVRADTLINPNTRINDPQMGTILVSVHNEAGTGIAGVSVSASVGSPANGAQPLTVTPTATDSEGCTYILKVAPGNYDVTISKSGFISGEAGSDPLAADPAEQATSPKAVLVPVAASTSVSVEFEYDQKGTYQVAYHSNPAPGSTMIPTDLDTSFMNSRGVSYSKATTASFSRTIDRFPYGAGYTVLAGKYIEATELSGGCLSPNPGAWIDGLRGGQTVVGLQPEAVSAAPGGSVNALAPMGIVQVSNASGKWFRATTSTTLGAGDPGCVAGMTYTTGQSSLSTARIALPFGTWRLESKTTSTGSWTVVASGVSNATTGATSGNLVTLDPRVVP